jgi:hypothetical protein
MKYVNSLNLLQNELQNAVIQVLATDPANGKMGQIYYNSTIKALMQYDGTQWNRVGVVYQQDSTTGAVITGLDASGNVTTTNVTGLTLTDYTPVEDGYVSANMSLEDALKALDTAVKNAVAGGGEVNQNAWSNISVKKQSTATTAVTGAAADTTIAATAKTDTFSVASGNKWVDVGSTGKQINIGHSLSGVTAGTTGAANSVPAITVDAAGHITKVEAKTITAAAIGADPAGSAAAVLGVDGDTSDKNTVFGVKALATQASADAAAAEALANEKVASVGATANGGIEIGGTATEPTVGIKLDPASGNAATLGAAGLMVTIPEVTVPEYTIKKLATATTGYLASYQLEKDGAKAGEVINIPKDYLVKSAEIKTSTGTADPSKLPEGSKYIDFVINTYDTASGTGTESHIYLDVQSLVDVYTAGNGIEISEANAISAKVVAANGLSVGATGIAMALVSADTNGAMSSTQFTKLAGIDEGATKNTITLNGTVTKTPSFYAPTTAGTSGQHLVSNGTGAPTWQNMPTILKKYTATNGAITAVGGAFSWTIAAATHGVSSPIAVQVYEVSTGGMVLTDVSVATNGNVTIGINDTENAGTLTAGTYRVVIIG